MELYFFTAADRNPVYRREAEILRKSGDKYDREIHLHDVPPGQKCNRHKINLLGSRELPEADKYIYLDSDTVLTCHGDWESDECEGIADSMYGFPEDRRAKNTMGFMRNHTSCIGEAAGFKYILKIWIERNRPLWCNSGVIVLKAEDRIKFCNLWRQWMERIDARCEKGPISPDEPAIMFAREDFGLPLLPPRFNGMCKWQPIYDWHVLIHADGNVDGEERKPYTEAVRKVMEP